MRQALVTIATFASLLVGSLLLGAKLGNDAHEQGRKDALAESADGVCALNAAKTLVEQFDAIDASIVEEK